MSPTDPAQACRQEAAEPLAQLQQTLLDLSGRQATPTVRRDIQIYFEPQMQHAVLLRRCRHLPRGDFASLGYTELAAGFRLPLQLSADTVFRRTCEIVRSGR